MAQPPDLWPVDTLWFNQVSSDISLIFIHAEELLCYWRGISSQTAFDGCSDLIDACLIGPEIIEVLNQELRHFGNEFSAAASLPVAYEDVVAPNTPNLILECAYRFFVGLERALNDAINARAKAKESVNRPHAEPLVREYLPRVNMEELPFSPLSIVDFRRLRSMLEQELCRAYANRLQADKTSARSREQSDPLEASVPSWNRARSTLNFGNKVSKAIRRLGNATNVVRVLDAFQELGWPERIDDPLLGGADGQRLHETIRSLNSGLRFVRFRADGTGQGILWEPAAQPPDASRLAPG